VTEKGENGKEIYDLFGLISVLNAGLSKFSSQTFSGISPIMQTECHVWSHSLVGIGIANLAVFHFRQFLQSTIGNTRIPQLFELFKEIIDFPDLCSLGIHDPFWYEDHLRKLEEDSKLSDKIAEIKTIPLVPLVTFFSRVDGFKSHHNTLSLPLESIYACNTPEWSLLTTTHEITHTFVNAILAILYPDLDNEADVSHCWELTSPVYPKNFLDMIRKYFFLGVIDLEICAQDKVGQDFVIASASSFKELLEKWKREVEEIMVDTFDFLYFYNEVESDYITQIWTSWSVIPHIKNRVPEYVKRTLCALMTKNLNRGAISEKITRDKFVEILTEINKKNPEEQYIQNALTYIKENWDTKILPNLLASKTFVKIVHSFLYSEKLASVFSKETWLLELNDSKITDIPITNPLMFISRFSKTSKPSMAKSLWIYHNIVFNYEYRHK